MADQFRFDVFLSHNKADKPRVRPLAERLRAAGLRVWFDEWIIKPGDDIYLAIERGLEVSRTVVLCLSPAALESDWVRLERSTVLFRDPSNAGRRFIPLLLAGCKLPDTLRRYRYVDYGEEAEEAFAELLAVCRVEAEAGQRYDSLPEHFPQLTPFFIGRTRAIAKIRKAFASRKGDCAILAIHGISGVGKTQLAIAYARKFAGEYDVIAFLRAEQTTSLDIDYADLSTRLMMNVGGGADLDSQRRWIRDELARRDKWLIVLDNATDFDAVAQYIPNSGNGHVLITSQNALWDAHRVSLLELGSLESQDAMDLVRTRSHGNDEESLRRLADELGNLPLALSQAAAYCRSTRDTVAHYLAMLETRPLAILEENRADAARVCVARTWELALNKVKATNVAAIQFLKMCSFLAADDIPLDVLVPARKRPNVDADEWKSKLTSTPEPLRSDIVDGVKFGRIVNALLEFTLVSVENQRLSMHRLLQLVVRHTVLGDWEVGPRSAIELITSQFPIAFSGSESRLHRRPDVVPHAIAAIEHALELHAASPAELLFLAERRDMEGKPEEAIDIARHVLLMVGDADVEARVSTTIRLAGFLDHTARSREAVPMLLALRQKLEELRRSGQLSGGLVDTYWWGLYQLGVNQRQMRLYAEARDVLQTVYRDGPPGGKRLSARHQLGVIDLLLGDLESAEERFLTCLAERGSEDRDHRRAFETRRLGQVHALRREFREARQRFDEAIRISEKNKSCRYVDEVAADIKTFVEIPQELLSDTRPAQIVLSDLSSAKRVPESRLSDSFRVLNAAKHGYLAEIDAAAGNPTGVLVDFDKVHREGVWHATVAIAIFDSSGKLAIQRRGEQQSSGKWDISVAGHVDIGETDIDAAVRETYEELGFLISSDRLRQIGDAYSFSKRGSPEITNDRHSRVTDFEYASSQINYERISVFRVTLNDNERLCPRKGGAAEIRWVSTSDAVGECTKDPSSFASSVKHLFCHEDSLQMWS